MTMFIRLLTAAAAVGAFAAPAAAQYSQPYPYPQQYPPQGYPQQGYPQQYPGYGYGYGQGYGQNPIGQIIDQLLGNRYSVTDRAAVSQCAAAAVAQASNQYRGGYGGYGNRYSQGYNNHGMRVTAITDVQRRSNGLRVRGLIDSGMGYRRGDGYGGQYTGEGYANRGYAGSDLTFRCNVDYRGVVTNVRIGQNTGYPGR